MLKALLAQKKLLREGEADAFENMQECLDRTGELSRDQASWVEDAFERLEQHPDTVKNLFSEGRVKIGQPVIMGYDALPSRLRKPLRPPRKKI
jgi:hypothetical protein